MKKRQISIIIFYTKDKKILLQDRTFKNNHEETWGFFGGGIEEGETKEQALIRETKEELTFDLTNYKYIGEYGAYIPSIDTYSTLYTFISPLEDINLFKQNEGDNMGLFSIEEARKLHMRKEVCYKILDMLEDEFKDN